MFWASLLTSSILSVVLRSSRFNITQVTVCSFFLHFAFRQHLCSKNLGHVTVTCRATHQV